MTFDLAECSIRVTVLVEYLDLVHIVGFQILLYYYKDDYSDYRPIFSSLLCVVCLVCLQTNRSFLCTKLNHVILMQVGLHVISSWPLF